MKRTLPLLSCLYFCLVSTWCLAQEPIIISFPETEVQPNATFCLDVQATNFDEIEGIQFALKWKTEHLKYQSINIYRDDDQTTTYLPNLNLATNFAEKGGTLRFLWLSNGLTTASLPEKSTLFQICFKTSDVEAITDIQMSEVMAGEAVRNQATEITPVILENTIININNNINQTDKAIFSIGSKNVKLGDSFCVPVTAKKLENLEALELAIVWDEELLSFKELKTTEDNPLGITQAANYLHREGYFKFAWVEYDYPLTIEVPDDFKLFDLCFDEIGNTERQTQIEFLNGALSIE
ncbi:MAG: cohesin domain-containing protein, partial [Bacteroidota bacterium]